MTSSDRTALTDRQLDDLLAAVAEEATVDDRLVSEARSRVLDAVSGRAATSPSTDRGDAVELTTRPPHRRPGWRRALVAAAVVIVVGGAAVAWLQTRGSAGGQGPAASAQTISCLVEPSAPSPAADARAISVLRARALAISPSASVVSSMPGRVDVTAPDATSSAWNALCTSPQPSLRPLVTAPVPVPRHQPDQSSPAATASPSRVHLPTSDTEFDALTTVEQQQVRDAVLAAGCDNDSSTAPADHAVVVCDSRTSPTLAYLLGPAVVTADQFDDASTMPSPADPGSWLIEAAFTPAGAGRLLAYTTAHHASGSEQPGGCGSTAAPCAAFIGIVAADTVVAAPVITGPVPSTLQLQGAYDQTAAQALTAELAAGGLTIGPA